MSVPKGIADWVAETGAREVQVAFSVPVEVVVDLESRKVVRVVSIHDEVAPTLSEDGTADVHTAADYEIVLDSRVRDYALAIADAPDIEWPAWES